MPHQLQRASAHQRRAKRRAVFGKHRVFLYIHVLSSAAYSVQSSPTCLQVCFCCDSVQLAARLVQDMAQVFGISALTCEADFPKDLETLRQLLAQVADYNANRVKLSTDMADMCNMVKERVVKAEDCRIILDVSRARSAYIEIHDINLKLRQQYTKREANHNQLLACLKARPRCFDAFFFYMLLEYCVLLYFVLSGCQSHYFAFCCPADRRRGHQAHSCRSSRFLFCCRWLFSTSSHAMSTAIAQNDVPTLFRILRAGTS